MSSMSSRYSRRYRKSRWTATAGTTISRQVECQLYNDSNNTSFPQSSNVVHLDVGPTDGTTITLGGAQNFGISFIDTFQNMPNNSEITSLYEYVKCVKITRKIVPIYSSASSTSTKNSVGNGQDIGISHPTLMVYNDFDSREPVTAAMSLELAGTRRIKMSGGAFIDSWVPRVTRVTGSADGGGSLFNTYSRMPYVKSTEASSMVMYGRRYGVLDWPRQAIEGLGYIPYAWRIYTTYTYKCKGVK